jgi:cation diffusion facilitator CzcD-associated flavoprotein CzcO
MGTSENPLLSASPEIAVIGAGFAGLGMGYYLKQAGIESFTIYEKAGDLGGVWRDNTYPGAACDVASHLYSYAFEPHYPWSRRYGPQAEILDYLRHVADKHGIRPHIRFGRELAHGEFLEDRGIWRLHFTDGTTQEASAVITAVGQLNRPQIPRIAGVESFRGRAFHSARWEHDYDFRGKTVAVLGTGPSAVQFVPEIAKSAKRLYVYQRSPGWCVPKFDRPYTRLERKLIGWFPFLHDLDRIRIFWWYEFLASALQNGSRIRTLSRTVLRLAAGVLMRRQVRQAELRRKLTPDTPLGCKRILLSNDWLPALDRANVELVTAAITEIKPDGVLSADGTLRPVDAIVFGTGFAATQFLAPMEFRGLGGASLQQRWKDGAQAYLGVSVNDFPNLFMLYGPNTNLGAGSIIFMLERQQRYLAKLIAKMKTQRLVAVDASAEAMRAFNAEIAQRNEALVYQGGCNNWYLTNGRNTNNWVGYMSEYGRRLREPLLAHFRSRKAAERV